MKKLLGFIHNRKICEFTVKYAIGAAVVCGILSLVLLYKTHVNTMEILTLLKEDMIVEIVEID